MFLLNAALYGFGLAYVPEDLVEPILPKGVSSGCLKTGVPPFRDTTSITRADARSSPAFALLVDTLRYRG
jgi:DNA-binding transcriptional LysR family regulator